MVGTPAHFDLFDKDMESVIPDFRERGIIRDPDFPPDVDHWIDGFKQIEPRRWIRHFKGKHVLIMHGDEDELVPVDHARELQEAAPAGVVEICIIPRGSTSSAAGCPMRGRAQSLGPQIPRLEGVTRLAGIRC